MRHPIRGFLLFGLTLLLCSCAHSIHQVHVSDFSPYQAASNGQLVSSSAEQFVVLGLVYDTNYVNEAYRQLQAQCPSSEITGITTEYMTSLGFFSWTNKIFMKGRCNEIPAKSS